MSEHFENGAKLELYDGDQKLDFTIIKFISEGSSATCYKAVSGDRSGTLRAFTGVDSARYLEPYEQLKKIQRDNDTIKVFIPQVEIYFDAAGRPYIWNIEPELKTFEEVCRDFGQETQSSATDNLILTLEVIQNLTQCICELHKAGLIHRDIKPSNFGFKQRGGNILPETISLFDVDTICSVYLPLPDSAGTEGFRDFSEPVNNLNDIYSIGATFFYALAGSAYNDGDFNELENIVDECEIFANMFKPPAKLKPTIARILQRCLCRREQRYQSCEELLNELKRCRRFVEHADFKSRDAFTALQYHLYETPLYTWSQPSAQNLNVLIIGCDKYAQDFLDTCLTIGQIPGANLNVTIFGNSDRDFKNYLRKRPALKDFFNIGDEVQPDSYGSINFKKLALFDGAENKNLMQDLICDYPEPHYIFIALGDNSLNQRAAEFCREALEILKISCGISFVCEGGERKNCGENIFPVYVDELIKSWTCHKEIERMAFNVHLIWEKNLQVDYDKLRKKFREPYNHKSCVLYVVSMKYKLHGIGIEMDELSPYEAAEKFSSLNIAGHQRQYDELIYFEHRRWVTEKICAGWKRRKVHECGDGETRDHRKKTHVCIVKSKPNQNLLREFAVPEEWNNSSKSKLERLDDLDRMSLSLHRFFVEEKRKMPNVNIVNGEQMTVLKNLVGDDREVMTCLNEWIACMEDIWNGRRERIKLYASLRDNLNFKLKNLSSRDRKTSENLIKQLDQQFKIILESMRYENYKEIDSKLIRQIPFILTYTENIYLAVPYDTSSDKTEAFRKIAADIVVNAKGIIYLLYIPGLNDLSAIKSSLKNLPDIFKYASEKNLRAKFELVIAYSAPKIDASKLSDLVGELEKFEEVQRVKCLPFEKVSDVSGIFSDYLRGRQRPDRLLALEKNSTPLSTLFEANDVYDDFGYYEFNLKNQTFETGGECRILSYINNPGYITLTDLFPNIIRHDKPEFFSDYEKLWKLYRQNVNVWKKLCEWLGEESSAGTIKITEFNRKNFSAETKTFQYIIPIECKAVTEKIFETLKAENLVENDSKVIVRTPSTCDIIIKTKIFVDREEWDKLFYNPYLLMNPSRVKIATASSDKVTINFDSLLVRNLKSHKELKVLELLKSLDKMGYLIGLKMPPESEGINFTYSTHHIKKLLTVAGRILEIYVYHKIVASGKFDDVTCDCENFWSDDTDVKSEFDCVLTKGFQSIFIECKARYKTEQDFYYKLDSLIGKFGINGKGILVTDTLEIRGPNPENATQRQRGEFLGIQTIWKPDEIDDIDKKLLEILQDEN